MSLCKNYEQVDLSGKKLVQKEYDGLQDLTNNLNKVSCEGLKTNSIPDKCPSILC